MHFSSFLALGGLTLAAAAPAALTARGDATWTLQNFIRSCDDTKNSCDYRFAIMDNASGFRTNCYFTDDAAGTSRSARYSSPSNIPCSENSPIFINIGYDQPGNFFVVVPVNTNTKKNAFFGYTADELKDGVVVTPDHTSPTLTVGEFKKAKRDAEDLGHWSVLGLHRECSETACSHAFTIAQNNGAEDQTCHIDVDGPNTQSWHSQVCRENHDWVVSWGYNSQYGFAVMTIVNAPRQVDAFFGFNDVNQNLDFPDIGPEIVYSMTG